MRRASIAAFCLFLTAADPGMSLAASEAGAAPTTQAITKLKDQALLDLLHDGNVLPEGLWKGEFGSSPCFVSIDWDESAGPRTARILTYSGEASNHEFGYSDFELGLGRNNHLTAERGEPGVIVLKRQSGSAKADVRQRLWYEFSYPHDGKQIASFFVSNTMEPGTDRPPPLASCMDLVRASEDPAASPGAASGEESARSGDWNYVLKPQGEWSLASSQTVKGASLRFECDGRSRLASFRVDSGEYPIEYDEKEKLWLFFESKRTAAAALVSIVSGPDGLVVGAGNETALEFARLWSDAPSGIDVGINDARDKPAKAQRRFSARGSQKAIGAVMAQCGLE